MLNVEVGSMSENTILHHSDLGVRYSDFKFEYRMLNAECRILKLGFDCNCVLKNKPTLINQVGPF